MDFETTQAKEELKFCRNFQYHSTILYSGTINLQSSTTGFFIDSQNGKITIPALTTIEGKKVFSKGTIEFLAVNLKRKQYYLLKKEIKRKECSIRFKEDTY